MFWPHITFYKEQREIIYSVRDNDETFVPAGNELGKDFVSAFIALWFFCSRRPAKVVTTSPQAGQLEDVLWGEIRRFLDTAKYRLPIQYNHLKIRQTRKDGSLAPNSELVGRVVEKGESMLGRHVPRGPNGEPTTLLICDEASGMADTTYETADTWTHRKLTIGNPYPCENFFKKGVKAGDQKRVVGKGWRSRVIRIRAQDSPNVRYAMAEIAAGKIPSGKILVPGVVRYEDYATRREVWDPQRQSIGLDAEFYEGDEVKLIPETWFAHAEGLPKEQEPLAIGCDPAEGGDNTSWAIVGRKGLISLISKKTPNTTVIQNETIKLMREFSIPPNKVLFDRGGGGKQHADALREKGHKVRTVGFGEAPTDPKKYKRGIKDEEHRTKVDETKTVYKNKRAEMYGELRLACNPNGQLGGFSLPSEIVNRKRRDGGPSLREQLVPLPLQYDGEGKLYLPPKNKPKPNSKEPTITDLIGTSPDESDALVLALQAMKIPTRKKAGAI